MAKITAEFDTVAKTLSVSMDGSPIKDVVSARFGLDYYGDDEDRFRCEVTTLAEDEDTDVKTMTNLIASASHDGRLLVAAGEAEALPGFVRASARTSVQDSIAEFFARG